MSSIASTQQATALFPPKDEAIPTDADLAGRGLARHQLTLLFAATSVLVIAAAATVINVAIADRVEHSMALFATIGAMGGLFQVLLIFIVIANRTTYRSNRRLLEAVKARLAERKRVQAELQQSHEVAVQASRAKSDFLASMSHEIRTPMNAIIGMSELLSESPLTSDQQEYVRIIGSAGDSLLALIDNILDLSKVEAGQLVLEKIPLDPRELAEDAVEFLAVPAHEKGLELVSRVSHDVPSVLVGDPVRLRQVITNLVSNAIKFTDKGEVVLHLENDPEANEPGALRFWVSDTGAGIPPEMGEYIFDAFTQGDSSTTRRHGGTGLGLPISKRLVEAMGGRIWVDSKVGEGSTFYFTARFTVQADEGVTTAAPLPTIGEVKTLIVDDNATNRFLLKEILARWGAPATEVEDGKQALLELTRAKMKDEPYHLVLLDHRMPGMDGFETAERIKKSLGMLSTTIIMLTSENRAGDIETCRQLGISRYLVKPIKQSGLRAAVTAAIGVDVPATNGSSAPAVTSDSPEPSPLRVLLVEDSEDNLRLFQLYLKDPSYDVDVAEDGEVAVGKFMTGQYDLVLMDMQMPVMDGYTATKAIRKWEEENGRKPSVILALTAHALNGHGEKSLAAGCNAHIAKPVKKAVLLEALREHTMKVPA